MTEKYKELHGTLLIQVLFTHIEIVDNKFSKVLLEFMENYNVDFLLVPAHIHWRNAEELANRTRKFIFLGGLSSIDDRFPIHLWDWLLYQVDSTLNILRPIIINTPKSAYNMIWGIFEFNRTTMGPPVFMIIVHEKTGKHE